MAADGENAPGGPYVAAHFVDAGIDLNYWKSHILQRLHARDLEPIDIMTWVKAINLALQTDIEADRRWLELDARFGELEAWEKPITWDMHSRATFQHAVSRYDLIVRIMRENNICGRPKEGQPAGALAVPKRKATVISDFFPKDAKDGEAK